ncbi:Transcription factor CPC [Glycine soja]
MIKHKSFHRTLGCHHRNQCKLGPTSYDTDQIRGIKSPNSISYCGSFLLCLWIEPDGVAVLRIDASFFMCCFISEPCRAGPLLHKKEETVVLTQKPLFFNGDARNHRPKLLAMADSDRSSSEISTHSTDSGKRGSSKVEFSEDEETLIIRMYKLVGERWSLIAGRIPGRTAEEIEKYWTSRFSGSSE